MNVTMKTFCTLKRFKNIYTKCSYNTNALLAKLVANALSAAIVKCQNIIIWPQT